MSRSYRLGLILSVFIFVVTCPSRAATAPKPGPAAPTPALQVASSLSALTGIAISPLLGTAAYGAYQYYHADAAVRDKLPWFARPGFFLPALLIVLVCASKDTFGVAIPPPLKKPMDVLETMENKLSGLVAAGAVVPITMNTLSNLLMSGPAHTDTLNAVSSTGGLAMVHLASVNWSWLLDILTVPLGVTVFAVVWMASHAINVLILLSPWGAIDTALKGARTALLGLVTVTANLDPKTGAFLSLAIVVLAYFVAGWSFRLTVFGSIFCWDFLSGGRHRCRVDATGSVLFSSKGLIEAPVRTLGRLSRKEDGSLAFRYRPWLILPGREVIVPARDLQVGRGLFFSVIANPNDHWFILPPRYRGHEVDVNRTFGLGGVHDAGLRRAWGWIKESLGFRRAPSAA